MKKWKILIPSLIATASMPLIGLVGCNNEEPIDPINFNNASWSDIADAANKWESGKWNDQQLFSRFTVDGDLTTKQIEEKEVTSFADFVGQPRTVKVNNFDHLVKVVGCKEDFLDQNQTKPVLFSFHFENLISDRQNGNELHINWGSIDTYNKNYWDSILNNALNGTDPAKPIKWKYFNGVSVPADEQLSVYQLIDHEAANDGLAQSIKEVYRGVNVWEQPHWVTSYQKTKLFPLTIANCFSKEGIQNTTQEFIPLLAHELCYAEGKQYSYYAIPNHIADSPIDNQGSPIEFACLKVKAFEDKQSYGFWFASPLLFNPEGKKTVWSTNKDGKMQTPGADSYSFSVAPCFCL